MVFTTATIGFGTWLLDKIKDKGFDSLYEKLTVSNTINESFIDAVNIVSTKLQLKYPDILGARIEYFFKSESIFKELIKLIFINASFNIESVSNKFDIETLPPNFIYEFINELKLELIKNREIESIIANKELFIVISGIGNEVSSIKENSNLTLIEIKKIKSIVEQRIGENFILNDFLSVYSENAINNLSQVNFIGLGVGADISKKINRKNLEDVFVNPKFQLVDNKYLRNHNAYYDLETEDYEYEVDYSELFNFGDKIVILGNPGSGKSMLVKSIMCSMLNKHNDFAIEDLDTFIPFRIELRKYLAYKKQNRGNIIKYLNSVLEEEYSISRMTEILLEKLLKENRNIIFFDGLDEIFKIEDKIEIKNDIENFHNSFPLTKSLTTSRIIGYEEAKLNDNEFCEFNIENFDDHQIIEYLNRWYAEEEDVIERRQNEINGFLDKKHEIDVELVSNPLLLSLIVIIYRNTLALPESKLEIYESCTKTLVEKWDASKKDLEINLDASIYKKRENILADLAYWQYQQLSGDNILITFEKALGSVASSLERLKVADESDSFSLAENFMGYAQKRSIYFENNFTHKTFLEYYSAYWIYSNIEKKNKTRERNLIIAKYIDNPFWHIVLELLLNMIDKNQADNEMMDELINFQIENDFKSLPFVLSTLKSYKNISKECIEMVISKSINFLLFEYRPENFSHDESLHSKTVDLIKTLYTDKFFKDIILEKLRFLEETAEENIEFIYVLYFEIDYLSKNYDEEAYQFELQRRDKFDQILLKNKFLQISSCYNISSKECEINYLNVVLRYIESFGTQVFFDSIPFYFDSSSYLPMVYYFFRNQIKNGNIDNLETNLETLFKKGIDKDKMVKYLAFEKVYYYTEEADKSLLEAFSNKEEGFGKMIILLIMLSQRHTTYKFKELIKNTNDEDFFNELLSMTHDKRATRILEIYNYSSPLK